MPIPPLSPEGLLPPPVHDGTLAEIAERFGRDQWVGDRMRPCRSKLYRALEAYVAELRKAGLAVAVVVDGSFVTGEPEPHDVDLLVILPSDHDFGRDLRPFEYNLLSGRRVKAEYQFDAIVVPENSAAYAQWVEFFRRVRNRPGATKGLVRLRP
jgi:predicted nucleotidyltransferase